MYILFVGNYWVSLVLVFGLMTPLAGFSAGKSRSCNVSAVEISFQEILEFEQALLKTGFLQKQGRTAKEVWIKAQSFALQYGFKDLNEFSYALGEAVDQHREALSTVEDLMRIALSFEGERGSTKYQMDDYVANLATEPIRNDRLEFEEKLKAIEDEASKHFFITSKEKATKLSKSSVKKFGEHFEKVVESFLKELSQELEELEMSMQEILSKMETDEIFAYNLTETLIIAAHFNSLTTSNFIIARSVWQELQFMLKARNGNQDETLAIQFVLLTSAEKIEDLSIDFVERPSMTIRFYDALDQYDRDGHLFMRELRYTDDRIYRGFVASGVVIPTMAPSRVDKILAKESYDTYYKTEPYWELGEAESFFQWLQLEFPILRDQKSLADFIKRLSSDHNALKDVDKIVEGIDTYFFNKYRIEANYDPEVGIASLTTSRKLPESYYSFSFLPYIELAAFMHKDSKYIAEEVLPILDGLKELQSILDFERYDFPVQIDAKATH
ncbi:MAG: hypothetical protein VX642_13575 [Bdellovibrionota bacterium]|nr:hypothetical protein [Bdellovibrionota bacterium]